MIFKQHAAPRASAKRSHIVDPEFGIVECRRTSSRFVRIRVTEQGTVRATLPRYAPLRYVEQLLDKSRDDIRKLLAEHQTKQIKYSDGMQLGHSHKLSLLTHDGGTPRKRLRGQTLELTLPNGWAENDPSRLSYISGEVKKVLRREAEAYLPRRLSYLADAYGFSYSKIRYGNPKGRWGSCSAQGTISLNVALMNTPHDVIDYVLLHELAHTKHMNHSPEFWATVEACMPNYKEHKKTLKTLSPIC